MELADDNDHGAQANSPGALRGPGVLQWSSGGWYGSLIGGSAWMMLGSFLMASKSRSLAWTWATCGLISISVGVWLWSQRSRLRPYPAIMGLMLTLWLTSTVAIVSAVVLGPRATPPFEAPTGLSLFSLLIFPGLMLQFTLMERGSKA